MGGRPGGGEGRHEQYKEGAEHDAGGTDGNRKRGVPEDGPEPVSLAPRASLTPKRAGNHQRCREKILATFLLTGFQAGEGTDGAKFQTTGVVAAKSDWRRLRG